jgi:ribonuclease HIII
MEIEDEREFIIEPKEYNQMLKQFASEHGIKNVLYKPE